MVHKCFISWLSTFIILTALSQIVHTLLWVNLILRHMSIIRSPFSIWLITSNFSSILIVFQWFFTWIALGEADLCFSLILVTKANTLEGGTTSATWLYHQCNRPTHVTDGMTVTSLCASLQHEASAAMGHIRQNVFNWKISRIVYAKSR